ncbi:MAG: NAD(P)-dependent oxidoreductase [Chromatiales bacterium]|nr:NAD(P)-dependent oxidoreductase [Chromatiales bacterium]
MHDLSGKTLFITGGSRGIGRAIALRAAQEGANVVLNAKTDQPHPKLPGTIHSVAAEIEAAGGKALPLQVDIRDETRVAWAVEQARQTFGGIDMVVNNASAISLSATLDTPVKRFDLMMQVNLRGTFVVSQACLPALLEADNPHILVLSPPMNLNPRWFKHHTAYTLSKYGMSMCVLGMAAEFSEAGVGVNALWPMTVIDTAALAMLGGRVHPGQCRDPAIVADAAVAILKRDSRRCSGNFFLDEEVLRQEGVSDFSIYGGADETLMPDLFV